MVLLGDRLKHREAVEQDRDWIDKIPFIKWPDSWKVKAIPPTGGAVIRYQVINQNGAKISIYLDCYDAIGYNSGNPYWEFYPNEKDGCTRAALSDIEELLIEISKVTKGLE